MIIDPATQELLKQQQLVMFMTHSHRIQNLKKLSRSYVRRYYTANHQILTHIVSCTCVLQIPYGEAYQELFQASHTIHFYLFLLSHLFMRSLTTVVAYNIAITAN